MRGPPFEIKQKVPKPLLPRESKVRLTTWRLRLALSSRLIVPDQLASTPTASPPDAPKPRGGLIPRRRWLWVVGLILLLVVTTIYVRQRQSKAQQPTRGKSGTSQPPLMVSTATAQKGDIGVYVNALGVVTPVNTVAVRSRVDGQLVKVHYVEGQTVHQGDPLVEIDAAPFQAALIQAEGQFARDTALLENARLDLERY